jgi:tripartite-type tricarboxylate transporter receptor subunit TctC
MNKLIAYAIVAALGAVAAVPALAQQKVARIVIGFPPGASFDAFGRIVADRMTKLSGQQYIVENRPGATGTIGAEAVARAAPDGLTLLLTPLASVVTEPQVNKQAVRYDPFRDFTPISNLAAFEVALGVGPALPVKSLPEYMTAVKASRDRGFFTTPGPNTLPHFFGLLVGRTAKVELTHVPFAGPAAAIQAVLGGQVPAAVLAYPDLLNLHKAGKMRMLATSGRERNPLSPDVPTFRELGLAIEALPWYAFFGPAGMPRETVDRLQKLLAEAVRSKEVGDYLITSGHFPLASTPEQLADTLKRDYAFWGQVIRDSGIKIE